MRRLARPLRLAGIFILGLWLAGLAAASVPGERRALLLGVRLNGVELDMTVHAVSVGDTLGLQAQDWTQMQLRAPTTAPMDYQGEPYRLLSTLPGLRWWIDGPSQMLVIEAPPASFAGTSRALDDAPATVAPAAAGGYANYDLQWQSQGAGNRPAASALVETGGFTRFGSARLSGVVRSDATATPWTRLDTNWTTDLPERLASLRLGDAVGQAGSWGQPMRFGGVQWTTDFSVRPGFLSFPLPAMHGEATLPSTVDLYVNNSQRLQSSVPAGAFDLSDLPVVTGQGELRLVVRDLLGREQVIVRPYYASPAMLRPGLHAVSYELGKVREDYGLASDHYGPLFASATDRAGVSDTFTRELRVEALGSRVAAGATGMWLWPEWGVLHASSVVSQAPAGRGAMIAAGTERQSRDWSGSVDWRYSSPHFTQAGASTDVAPHIDAHIALGRNWLGTGIGLSLVQQSRWQGATQRFAALNLSHGLGPRGLVGLFVQRDLATRRSTLVLSLSLSLDERSSASVSATRNPGAAPGTEKGHDTLQWQRNAPEGTGTGYQVLADDGAARRISAQGTWQIAQAEFSGGLAHTAQGDDARAGVSGGVAWLGDSVFLSRRIEGSFAIVDVGGYPGVQVLQENRPVARTDVHGRALVSGLRGFDANRIGVDPADLPWDAEVDTLETLVTPPARSGVAVRIAVRRARSASFRLLTAQGVPPPPGSLLSIEGQGRTFPVGFAGRAFASGLGARTRVDVRWNDHACSAWLELTPQTEDMADLGPVECL